MTIDKSEARVRRMFGQIAGLYDLLNHLLSLNVDRYWRWRTVRAVPPQGDAPILDICTGTGDLALAYYRNTGNVQVGDSGYKNNGGRINVVGADFCHPMLQIGRQKAARAGANGHLAWVEADSQRLPFPDDYFQIVSVAFGLRNVTDTDRGLREMVRVCRRGGRVAVLEFSMPTAMPLKAIYGWYFRHVLPRIGQFLARNRDEAYNYLPQTVSEFPQGEALAEKLRAAELTDVRHQPLTFGVATLYTGTKAGHP